ncbi:MAG TPA: hypothetical protein VMG08_17435 [Allosphingosinicella sp.]|nr:hypothetical protein [Allosphingosinicella sp.]
MLWSPARVALAGIVVWLVMWLIAPLREMMALNGDAMLFIGACYLAFGVGIVVESILRNQRRPAPRTLERGPLDGRLFAITMVLGLIGMGARYYDRAFVRGINYSLDSAEVRSALESAAVSGWGMVGAILMPFCLIPLILMLSSNSMRSRLSLTLLALVLFIMPTLENLAQLSRSIMFLSAAIAIAAVACLRFAGNPFRKKIVLPGLAAGVGLLFFSTLVFETRLNDYKRELYESVIHSVYAENIAPNDTALAALISGSPVESSIYGAILPNSLYYLSGMYEFTLLWERQDVQEHAYGAYMFYPVLRGFYAIAGLDAENIIDEPALVYRLGVTNTFFGPLWIDFGFFSLLVMAAFGFAMGRLSYIIRNGAFGWLPLYLTLISIIFYMPVVNFINNGFGLFFISAFVFYGLFIGRRARRAVAREAAAVAAG